MPTTAWGVLGESGSSNGTLALSASIVFGKLCHSSVNSAFASSVELSALDTGEHRPSLVTAGLYTVDKCRSVVIESLEEVRLLGNSFSVKNSDVKNSS